jgi:hypothetical protein
MTDEPPPNEGSRQPFDERVVRLPVSTVIRVLQLVEKGVFPSFDAAVVAGLDSLTLGQHVVAPTSRVRLAPTRVGFSEQAATSPPVEAAGLLGRPASYELVLPTSAVPINRVAWKLLGFTASRFFPIKVALRMLAAELGRPGSPFVDLNDFRERIGARAVEWGAWLANLDSRTKRPRGERVATGFPTPGREQWKSVERFLDSYVASTYRDGRAVGAAVYLGYVGLNIGAGGPIQIGLTERGLAFARLVSPVLDNSENRFPPFSSDEVETLVNDIADRSQLEASHILHYLTLLRDRPGVSRQSAIAFMRPFYERVWDPTQLTPALVESMRMAVHSRTQELGFAETSREGREVAYRLSERGQWAVDTLRRILSPTPQLTQGGGK